MVVEPGESTKKDSEMIHFMVCKLYLNSNNNSKESDQILLPGPHLSFLGPLNTPHSHHSWNALN